MNTLKRDILNILARIKGSGKFVTTHTADFVFPGLEIRGAGEVAYPINETQAKALIKVAHKAPFGKGSETILDNAVRSAWEIDAGKLKFNENNWSAFLKKVLQNIKPQLGIKDDSISAELYKMLIYEKGDFFLSHKDSEKEKGMFGTLIIGLPSRHTGGELIVKFDGREETVSFAKDAGNFRIPYTAFYADCDHELRTVSSGYRICLVYNLIRQKSGKQIQPESFQTHAQKLTGILKEKTNLQNSVPYIVLLGHQYTPENFSIDSLKLNDRHKAEILLRAAEQAGYYAKMCLVTSFLSGSPACSGGGYYGDDDDTDEDAPMEEVFDESLSVQHWAKDGLPPLRNMVFEKDELITSFELNEGDPIMKESTGYMGNYGPDLMHWYHYGAVILWSKSAHFQLLSRQENLNKLEWIDYYNRHYPLLHKKEIAAVENLLATLGADDHIDDIHDTEDGDDDTADTKQNPNYNAIAEWVINTNNPTFFSQLPLTTLQLCFTEIDTASWLKLINAFSIENTGKLFDKIMQHADLKVVAQLLSVLTTLVPAAKFHPLINTQMLALPQYFSKIDTPLTNTILQDIFKLEKRLSQAESWVDSICKIITAKITRTYIHSIIAPEILKLDKKTALSGKIHIAVQAYLRLSADSKPKMPANWSRPLPETTTHKTQWQILKTFLNSPTEQVFDYRKNEQLRKDMEYAIRNAIVDLKTETIRTGSPYTLRISKTIAAYKKQLKNWQEDVTLLGKLEHK